MEARAELRVREPEDGVHDGLTRDSLRVLDSGALLWVEWAAGLSNLLPLPMSSHARGKLRCPVLVPKADARKSEQIPGLSSDSSVLAIGGLRKSGMGPRHPSLSGVKACRGRSKTSNPKRITSCRTGLRRLWTYALLLFPLPLPFQHLEVSLSKPANRPWLLARLVRSLEGSGWPFEVGYAGRSGSSTKCGEVPMDPPVGIRARCRRCRRCRLCWLRWLR
jgi:hypothetical protein